MAVDKDFKVKNGLVVVTTASFLSGVDASSTSTGAVQIAGGAGIGKSLYVGSAIYISGSNVLTDANFTTYVNQTYIFAGTDTAVNTSSGNVTVWNNSTLQSITNRGSSTNNSITITNTTSATSTLTGALQVRGGAGIGGNLIALGIHTPSGLADRYASTYDLTGDYGHFKSAANIGRAGGGSLTFGDGSGPAVIYAIPGGVGDSGYMQAYVNNNAAQHQLWYGTKDGLIIGNGSAPGAKLDVNGTARISGNTSIISTTSSISTTTGALQVIGGVGIGGNIYARGNAVIGESTGLKYVQVIGGSSGTGSGALYTLYNGATTVGAFGNKNAPHSTAYDQDVSIYTLNNFFIQTVGNNDRFGVSTAGVVTVYSPTIATSTNSGAFQVVGGVGIGQSLFVGGATTLTGIVRILDSTSSTTTATGALIITGGLGVGRTINALEHHTPTGLANRPGSNYDITGNYGHFQNSVNIGRASGGDLTFGNGNTPSIIQGFPGLGFIRAYINNNPTNNQLWYGNSTGLVVGNGTSPAAKLDVVGSVRISGITTITNTTAATSTQTGALQVVGGVGIGGNAYVGGNLNVSGEIVATKLTIELTTVTTTLVTTDDIIQTANTTNSTATNLGALVIAGGAGIGKRLSVGEILKVFDTTSATSSLTGALQVVGGAGIQGSLFVGGNLNVGGTITGSISGSSNTATNLAGGLSGQLLYQVNPGQTGFVATGTDGTVLVSKGSNQPVYQNTLTLAGTTSATSTQSGALQVVGGVGIQGNLFAYGKVVGGSGNSAAGNFAATLGGANNQASGDYSQASGKGSTTRGITGVIAYGFNRLAQGDSQTSDYFFTVATTTSTTTATITTDGGVPGLTNQIILPNTTAFGFRGMITARDSTNGWISVWELRGGIRKGLTSATTALVGTPIIDRITYDDAALTWDIQPLAETSIGGLQLRVIGSASANISWVAKITTIEVQ